MNEREKEVFKSQLQDEEKTLKYLKQVYKKSAEDVRKKIADLNSRTDLQNLQTIIYQRKYQEALLKQIDTALEDLNKNQYKTLNDFFEGSYVNGYVGSMYNLEGQGIPMTVPIDPKKMVRAVQIDSKLSKNYYQKRLFPENISRLKLSIKAEVSRGIATGETWLQVAEKIATGMNSPFTKALSDAMRIVRTEGHRVNQQGFVDAGDVAKSKGADIVKQWDATLDSRTRPWHQEADGQIREWDDDFIVHGEKMKAPSLGGSASNVINCRCQLLQRAKWALDEDELKTLEERAKFYGLDKTKDFEEYKNKYLNLPVNEDGSLESIEDMELKLEKLEDDRRQKLNEIYDLESQEKRGDYLEKKQKTLKDSYPDDVVNLTEDELKKLQKLADDGDEYAKEIERLTDRLQNIRKERPHYEDFPSEELYDKAFDDYLQLKRQLQEEKEHFWDLLNQSDEARNKLHRHEQFLKRYEALNGRYKTHLELLKEIEDAENAVGDLTKTIDELKKLISTNPDFTDPHCRKWLKVMKDKGVQFNPVSKNTKPLTQQEIIDILAGNDKTDGSCASVGFAYIGQKNGYDVRDFRGGLSMEQFREWGNLTELTQMDGLKILKAKGASSTTVAKRLLKQCELGKEYYLCTGRHASIVRKTNDGYEYLELQSNQQRGWTKFDKKLDYTLNWRFGCTKTSQPWHELYDFMIDLDGSQFKEKDLQKMLGYINTDASKEMKGVGGSIK